MKLVLIADMHGLYKKMARLPKGDILVCAGDISNIGGIQEIQEFNNWIGTQPFEHKIVVAGNHDWAFKLRPYLARLTMTNCIYLEDSSIEVEGLKFYGSPWQPAFCHWAFNLKRGPALAEKWAMIPNDTDVLVTHCGPRGILDKGVSGEALGCDDLLKRVKEVKPKLHVFGHIHNAYGTERHDTTTFVNATVCNEVYSPINPAIVIEI